MQSSKTVGSIRDYEILRILGDGTFGTVSLAKEIKTGKVVAIKKMKQPYYTWNDCVKLKEVEFLRVQKHPNIVNATGIFRENNILYFIFEYVKQNLYEMLKERTKPYTESTVRKIVHQIVLGIDFMHHRGYFHRDLKPENILCQDPDHVKLADFGQVREIRSRPPYTDYVSTRWYRAPEVQLGSTTYNSPIDIWAIGCIMAEVYTGRPLFPSRTTVDHMFKISSIIGTPTHETWNEGMILANKMNIRWPLIVPTSLSAIVSNASDCAINVMLDMLQWDPRKRPLSRKVLKNKFFQVSPITSAVPPTHNYPPRPLPQGDKGRRGTNMMQQEREGNSQDSGVHSDIHHPISGHVTPQATRVVPQASHVVPQASHVIHQHSHMTHTNNQSLPKHRTLNNPVLMETTPKRVLPPLAQPSPPPSKIQEAGTTCYKLPSIDKKEAAKYYMDRSRYSPLTSRPSNKALGFGSTVPRFNDSAKSKTVGTCKRTTPLPSLLGLTASSYASTVHQDRVIQRNDWTKRYRK